MDHPAKQCSYPGCTTILSRYNDGPCCINHEQYNRKIRLGLHYATVPTEAETPLQQG